MIHYDYTWDLYPNYILLDDELPIDRLGWQEGDYFKIKKFNGRTMIAKVDPLISFVHAPEELPKATQQYQFAVYTRDDCFPDVVRWIKKNNIRFEAHLNRTRFWITDSPELLEFLLTWGHACPRVDHEQDHLLGV